MVKSWPRWAKRASPRPPWNRTQRIRNCFFCYLPCLGRWGSKLSPIPWFVQKWLHKRCLPCLGTFLWNFGVGSPWNPYVTIYSPFHRRHRFHHPTKICPYRWTFLGCHFCLDLIYQDCLLIRRCHHHAPFFTWSVSFWLKSWETSLRGNYSSNEHILSVF